MDRPELCDATTPSIVDRDPVVIAIGTEGTAPVLGRTIKTQIESLLHINIGQLARLSGQLRGRVAQNIPRPARRAFWEWVFNGTPSRQFSKGDAKDAEMLIDRAIDAGKAPGETGQGRMSYVVTLPGQTDLLSLRAVHRLQEADAIYFDECVDDEVLELARRDADRLPIARDQSNVLSFEMMRRGRTGERIVRIFVAENAEQMRQFSINLQNQRRELQVEHIPFVGSSGQIVASTSHQDSNSLRRH